MTKDQIPDDHIPDPIAGAYMTYSVGGKNIFSVLNGLFPSSEETKTFPIVEYGGRLCLENPQGVKTPIKGFMKNKRISSYYFHTKKRL